MNHIKKSNYFVTLFVYFLIVLWYILTRMIFGGKSEGQLSKNKAS